MGKQPNPYPLRVSDPTFSKIRVLAELNDRSLNGQIENILKKYVAEYENAHGEIKGLPDE